MLCRQPEKAHREPIFVEGSQTEADGLVAELWNVRQDLEGSAITRVRVGAGFGECHPGMTFNGIFLLRGMYK